MATMDIFNRDAFSMATLTDAIIKKPLIPSLIQKMNIFEKQSVNTLTIQLEKTEKGVGLVQTSQRGSTPEYVGRDKRAIRPANPIRLARGFVITADELQGVRAFGKESELMQVAQLVSDRMGQVNDDLALTEERLMLGAVQGKVYDADDTLLYDWYDFWGITQSDEISFDFSKSAEEIGAAIRNNISRQLVKKGQGVITPNTQIVALCGDNFFDALIGSEAYRGDTHTSQQSQALMEMYGVAYDTVKFAGITWINYAGAEDGKVGIATDEVKFFPKNARGLFKKALVPAEFMETVNTMGKERYVKMIKDKERNMWVKGEVYTNPLYYCTRPELLFRGKKA